jgi:hypothetical protein
MKGQIIPNRIGQIVRVINPLPGEYPMTDYMLAEEPDQNDPNERIMAYKISEILRKTAEGVSPIPDYIAKQELTVIAENLKSWVESWNE